MFSRRGLGFLWNGEPPRASPGRRVVYRKETPMCNLFLTMMDRMGTKMDHFGDATGHLNGLDIT